MSHTHSSYGLGRYFVTYITNTTLLHTGAVILVESHVRNFNNMSGLFVKDSKSMRFGGITNKDILKSFRVKLGQMNTLSKIEALTTEYSKVFDVRLVAGEDLTRSLVQALADIAD
jgi:hypothetical protein